MNPRPLTTSANYLATVRGLRELHRLTVAGRQDSPEADAVRDATDVPWQAFTEVEKRRIGGLSEDLHAITDPQQVAPRELNPQVQSRLVDVDEARQRGEWDRALEILRHWAASIEPSVLSYLRGFTWLGAGDPETAALFFEHASKRQPENGAYLAMLLEAMDRFNPAEARRRAREILETPDRYEPVVVAFATDVVLDSVPSLPQAEASQLFRRLIPILESTLNKIEEGDEGGVDRSTFSRTCRLLGFCLELLEQYQAALRCYSRGIAADPSNDVLLVTRGILLYGESPRAVKDFESAIQSGSTAIWPFFFLAHHSLLGGLFERCRSLSERALEMEGSDAVKSELAEWLAISQSELGYPEEIVRESFDRSIRLDPSNERARRNLAAFEAAARPIPASVYEIRDRSAIRVSGMSEGRFRPARPRPAA
jgi:tetratricopeptide (TPR) repeat protein